MAATLVEPPDSEPLILDLRQATPTESSECNGLRLAPLPLTLPAELLAALERPLTHPADRLYRPLAKRVSSWLTKQQVVLMPPGVRHFVPSIQSLDRANVSFCHGNKERELSLAKRIRNTACAMPDASECQVARVYVELPLHPLPPPLEMQYGRKVVFAHAWMPLEFLRSTKVKDAPPAAVHLRSSFVTMLVDGVRYSRVAFSAVIGPPALAVSPAPTDGASPGGGGGGDGATAAGASGGEALQQAVPQVALRWDPVERTPGCPPAYDTALRVFAAHDTLLAEGPIELRWFPPSWVPGSESVSATADDKTLPLPDRARRAALRSVAESWFSYAHLAKVPAGAASGGGGGLPPRVEDFDRRGVVITHTSDDATGFLASEVMDASKPLPDMSQVHLARIYYSWPIPAPKSLPTVKEKGGCSPAVPFAFGWLPASLCGPPLETGAGGSEADEVEKGHKLIIDGAAYVRCVYSVRAEHSSADDTMTAHISWSPFARAAITSAAAAAAAAAAGLGSTAEDAAALWTADGFHLNSDLSKALWKALSSAYVANAAGSGQGAGGSESGGNAPLAGVPSAAAAAQLIASASRNAGSSLSHQLGWTAYDILDLLRDEGAFGDSAPPPPEALQRHMSPGYVPASRLDALRYICFFGEQANLMLDGCTAEMSFVCLAFAAAEQSVLPGLRTRSLRWSRAAEEAEKLVSRWVDSAESTTMAGVASRALALAAASLASPCLSSVGALAAVAAVPGPCIEALQGGRSALRSAVDIFSRAVRAVQAGGAFPTLAGAEAFVRLVAVLILVPFVDFEVEAEFLIKRMRDSGDGAGFVPDADAYDAEPPVLAARSTDFLPMIVSLGKAAAAQGRVAVAEKSIDELLAELGASGGKSDGSEKQRGGGKNKKKKAAAAATAAHAGVPAEVPGAAPRGGDDPTTPRAAASPAPLTTGILSTPAEESYAIPAASIAPTPQSVAATVAAPVQQVQPLLRAPIASHAGPESVPFTTVGVGGRGKPIVSAAGSASARLASKKASGKAAEGVPASKHEAPLSRSVSADCESSPVSVPPPTARSNATLHAIPSRAGVASITAVAADRRLGAAVPSAGKPLQPTVIKSAARPTAGADFPALPALDSKPVAPLSPAVTAAAAAGAAAAASAGGEATSGTAPASRPVVQSVSPHGNISSSGPSSTASIARVFPAAAAAAVSGAANASSAAVGPIPEVAARPSSPMAGPTPSEPTVTEDNDPSLDDCSEGGNLLSLASPWPPAPERAWAAQSEALLGGFGGQGLLGLPLLHEQTPLLPHQQRAATLDASLVADLVASISGVRAARSEDPGGGLSELVQTLIAGRDSAVLQQASAERRLQEGVTLVLSQASAAMAEMNHTVDSLRAQIAAQEAEFERHRAAAQQREQQLERELAARGLPIPPPFSYAPLPQGGIVGVGASQGAPRSPLYDTATTPGQGVGQQQEQQQQQHQRGIVLPHAGMPPFPGGAGLDRGVVGLFPGGAGPVPSQAPPQTFFALPPTFSEGGGSLFSQQPQPQQPPLQLLAGAHPPGLGAPPASRQVAAPRGPAAYGVPLQQQQQQQQQQPVQAQYVSGVGGFSYEPYVQQQQHHPLPQLPGMPQYATAAGVPPAHAAFAPPMPVQQKQQQQQWYAVGHPGGT